MKTKYLLIGWVFLIVFGLAVWNANAEVKFCTNAEWDCQNQKYICPEETKPPDKLYMVVLGYNSYTEDVDRAYVNSNPELLIDDFDHSGIFKDLIFELTPLHKGDIFRSEKDMNGFEGNDQFLFILFKQNYGIIYDARFYRYESYQRMKEIMEDRIPQPIFYKAVKIYPRSQTHKHSHYYDSRGNRLNIGGLE